MDFTADGLTVLVLLAPSVPPPAALPVAVGRLTTRVDITEELSLPVVLVLPSLREEEEEEGLVALSFLAVFSWPVEGGVLAPMAVVPFCLLPIAFTVAEDSRPCPCRVPCPLKL